MNSTVKIITDKDCELAHRDLLHGHKKCRNKNKCTKPNLCIVGYDKCQECGFYW